MIPYHQNVPNQLNEILTKTGQSLEDLAAMIRLTGLTDPNKIRWMLQREYRLGHEEAKTLVTVISESKLERRNSPWRK
ncbi:MAG TPA: DUF4287 domain-containing protein [Anaerolineales bacterium]|nr:DUF4287 domain-containing protein [Anaerolineales bacterium]